MINIECPRCKEPRNPNQFDGKHKYCIPCKKEYAHQYYMSHREVLLARSKANYIKNHDRVIQWKKNNSKKVRKHKRDYINREADKIFE